jgi:hypothetical protein
MEGVKRKDIDLYPTCLVMLWDISACSEQSKNESTTISQMQSRKYRYTPVRHGKFTTAQTDRVYNNQAQIGEQWYKPQGENKGEGQREQIHHEKRRYQMPELDTAFDLLDDGGLVFPVPEILLEQGPITASDKIDRKGLIRHQQAKSPLMYSVMKLIVLIDRQGLIHGPYGIQYPPVVNGECYGIHKLLLP